MDARSFASQPYMYKIDTPSLIYHLFVRINFTSYVELECAWPSVRAVPMRIVAIKIIIAWPSLAPKKPSFKPCEVVRPRTKHQYELRSRISLSFATLTISEIVNHRKCDYLLLYLCVLMLYVCNLVKNDLKAGPNPSFKQIYICSVST